MKAHERLARELHEIANDFFREDAESPLHGKVGRFEGLAEFNRRKYLLCAKEFLRRYKITKRKSAIVVGR